MTKARQHFLPTAGRCISHVPDKNTTAPPVWRSGCRNVATHSGTNLCRVNLKLATPYAVMRTRRCRPTADGYTSQAIFRADKGAMTYGASVSTEAVPPSISAAASTRLATRCFHQCATMTLYISPRTDIPAWAVLTFSRLRETEPTGR